MERIYLFSFIDNNVECLYRDIYSEKSPFVYLPSHKVFQNKVLQFIESLAFCYPLNKRFKIPFQSVFYNLESYPFQYDKEYFLIITTNSIAKFSLEYLEYFKTIHPNVKLIALFHDSLHAGSPHLTLVKDKLKSGIWEHILTYDKYDAMEFGFIWIGYTYYSAYTEVVPSNYKSDLFCVSTDRGRNDVFAGVYNYLTERGVACNFNIVNRMGGNLPGTKVRLMRQFMPYEEVVAQIKSSKCILEVLQPNQATQTIRYLEAVVYNKKLLTNNPKIEELPFYDSRYMKCFKSIEDIDYNWIKEDCTVNFDYQNEFSPIHLIDILEKL